MQKEVKELLENEFGTKVQVQESIVKTTVQSINKHEIFVLNSIDAEVNLKRSGTGITILVTVK